ncbi:putative spermidine/putrescine transport system substrate-binding protein [Rhodobium orientis]|uniref:ABC transporter substrate-binding protein n=1 Tax=Rhodobium orientis TaxID=34017 RepID=A0A327JHI1_9HYPH|nr:ABC transporter substrate-binding protein [Rhodobium orientis]MBB4303213.1 putative spermidine/putrescine transport system substrate-binding protein [Rhodobium orientis]MBK5951686.1 hypothetical protein [Rhodobium orientis]RAI25840.1 hypothetical protein CH339_16520 [Rhodobium orientis]
MQTRRTFLVSTVAAGAVLAAPAIVRAKPFDNVTLTLNGFGGDFDRIMKETVADPLKAETGLDVTYAPGGSSAAVAKTIATPDNPPFDIVLCDSPSVPELIKADMIDPVTPDKVPNVANLLPGLPEFGQHGVPFMISSSVITYNTEETQTPIASYADLARPDLEGRVALFNLENTGGVLYLLAMAEANGGGIDNIDPAFAALERIKPNIVTLTSSTVSLIQLFEQREATAGALWNGRVFAMQNAGQPMAMVAPSEGIYSLMSYYNPIKGTKHPEAVATYLNKALSDEAIGAIANFFRYGPTTTVDLPKAVADTIITFGPEGRAKIKTLDWTKIAEKRSGWIERFNRTMA